jgi:ketosteroid isomerase-like protein
MPPINASTRTFGQGTTWPAVSAGRSGRPPRGRINLKPVPPASAEVVVRSAYECLNSGDVDGLRRLLADDFVAELAEGMPLGVGGRQDGPDAMLDVWSAIGRAFRVRPKPREWLPVSGDRIVVLGRYEGKGRATGRVVDVAFAHVWGCRGGRIVSLRHFTDTAIWCAALAPE